MLPALLLKKDEFLSVTNRNTHRIPNTALSTANNCRVNLSHKNICEVTLKVKCQTVMSTRFPSDLLYSQVIKMDISMMVTVYKTNPKRPPVKFKCQTPQRMPTMKPLVNGVYFFSSSAAKPAPAYFFRSAPDQYRNKIQQIEQ